MFWNQNLERIVVLPLAYGHYQKVRRGAKEACYNGLVERVPVPLLACSVHALDVEASVTSLEDTLHGYDVLFPEANLQKAE